MYRIAFPPTLLLERAHFHVNNARIRLLHALRIYAFGPDPDEESKFCYVMTVVRSCGGEGTALGYRTELVEEHSPDSPTNEIIKVGNGKSTAHEHAARRRSHLNYANHQGRAEAMQGLFGPFGPK
jgi:hypothetical protein